MLLSKYRRDIDGLRAIAVISVVVFHAFPDSMPGGFIGVDIFFVISGFLITGNIINAHNQDRFSLFDFYIRRIRRIFPSLILVMFSVITVGYYILFPTEYKQLGQHAFGGATFIANMILFGESGYFDTKGNTKPLLHLWSLSIEEQFYLVWPLLLTLDRRYKLNSALTLAIITIISLGLCLFFSRYNPSYAFFMPHTRFWELAVGGGLAIFLMLDKPQYKQRVLFLKNFLSIIGLLLIAYGLGFIKKSDAFPGALTLVPTIGASLVLLAGPTAFLNGKVLGSKVLVSLGLVSYPLYLWHWPILSYSYLLDGGFSNRATKIIAITAAITLAWFTYEYVEKPLRFGSRARAKAGILIALMLGIGGLGFYIYENNGLLCRSISLQAIGIEEARKDWHAEAPNFVSNNIVITSSHFDGTSKMSALFMGDSLMAMYYPRANQIYSVF